MAGADPTAGMYQVFATAGWKPQPDARGSESRGNPTSVPLAMSTHSRPDHPHAAPDAQGNRQRQADEPGASGSVTVLTHTPRRVSQPGLKFSVYSPDLEDQLIL